MLKKSKKTEKKCKPPSKLAEIAADLKKQEQHYSNLLASQTLANSSSVFNTPNWTHANTGTINTTGTGWQITSGIPGQIYQFNPPSYTFPVPQEPPHVIKKNRHDPTDLNLKMLDRYEDKYSRFAVYHNCLEPNPEFRGVTYGIDGSLIAEGLVSPTLEGWHMGRLPTKCAKCASEITEDIVRMVWFRWKSKGL